MGATIIVKHYISPLFSYGKVVEWLKVTNPEYYGTIITHKEAKKFIEENHLELALKNENGEVYDTRDRKFQRLWKKKRAK